MNRNQTTVEMTAFNGVGGPFLTLQPQRVDVPPRDAFKCRDGVGADSLVRLRMPGTEPKIAGVLS